MDVLTVCRILEAEDGNPLGKDYSLRKWEASEMIIQEQVNEVLNCKEDWSAKVALRIVLVQSTLIICRDICINDFCNLKKKSFSI